MKKLLILVSTLIIASHAVVAFSQGEAAGGKVIIKKDLILHNRANSDAEIRDKQPIRKHDWSTSLRRGKYNRNGIKTLHSGTDGTGLDKSGKVYKHKMTASKAKRTEYLKGSSANGNDLNPSSSTCQQTVGNAEQRLNVHVTRTSGCILRGKTK